jgi:ferredoxin
VASARPEATDERRGAGGLMPFTKTEVDIHTDYQIEAVDPEWLKQGVKSPKHLMLDPERCILCRACEDVCPWNCIYMLAPQIVEGAEEPSVETEVEDSFAVFVVDDNACTRCSVCVDRCPTDVLYYARLPEDSGGARTMGAVPTSQRADAE